MKNLYRVSLAVEASKQPTPELKTMYILAESEAAMLAECRATDEGITLVALELLASDHEGAPALLLDLAQKPDLPMVADETHAQQ